MQATTSFKLKALVFISSFLFLCGCAKDLNNINDSSGQPLQIEMTIEGMTSESIDYSLSGALASSFDAQVVFNNCTRQGSGKDSVGASTTIVSNGQAVMLSSNTNMVWHDSCSIAFNYITVNNDQQTHLMHTGANYTLDSTHTGSALTPSYNPLYIYFQNGYALKITTSNLYGTTAASGTPVLTIDLITAYEASKSLVSKNIMLPMVGSGNAFSCGLVFPGANLNGGNVYCWGNNTEKVVDTSSTAVSYPKLVIDAKTLNGDGTNDPETYGVIPGIGSSSKPANPPVALSVGEEFFCVIDSLNEVWCDGLWSSTGNGSSDYQGDADGWIYRIPIKKQQDSNGKYSAQSPVRTGYDGSSIISVTVGSRFACALTSTSQLWCWGYLPDLPSGSFFDTSTPVKIATGAGSILPTPIKKISIGNTFMCAIVGSDAHVQCLGDYTLSQLGAQDDMDTSFTETVSYPVLKYDTSSSSYIALTGVKNISSSAYKTCATSSTETYCWGGILGIDFPYDYTSNLYYFNTLGLLSPNTYWSTSCYSSTFHSPSSCNFSYAIQPVMTNPSTVTSYPPALSALSVGMATVCGTQKSTAQYLCWGVDLTSPNPSPSTPDSSLSYSYWFGDKKHLFYNYVYGTNSRFSYQDAQINGVTTAGGAYTFSSNSVYSISVGSNYYYDSTSDHILPDLGQICAALTDGSIQCFGGNFYGQVGDGSSGNYITTPAVIFSPQGTNGCANMASSYVSGSHTGYCGY